MKETAQKTRYQVQKSFAAAARRALEDPSPEFVPFGWELIR